MTFNQILAKLDSMIVGGENLYSKGGEAVDLAKMRGQIEQLLDSITTGVTTESADYFLANINNLSGAFKTILGTFTMGGRFENSC